MDVEKQRSILSEAQDQLNILPDLAKPDDSDETVTETSTGAKIQCAKAKHANLKLEYIDLMAKKKLLDCLENIPQDEWSSAGVKSDDFKQTRRDLKKSKADMQNTEEELQELCAKADAGQKELESKVKLLQSKIESVEQKHNKLEQLKADRSSSMSKEQLQQQTAALQKAEAMISTYRDAVAQHQQEISKWTQTKEAMQALLQQTTPYLEQLKTETEAQNSLHKWKETWCNIALEKLTSLSGVKEHSIHGNNMTFELTSVRDVPVTALLTLKFREGKLPGSGWHLNDAELDIESLDITDIVKEAVRMNDAVFLVTQVKNRLCSHAPLRHEIEVLRHRYALDWLSDEGVITVIMGDKGQVVCSLAVDASYPGVGSVRLTAVEDSHQQIALDSFKPEMESPTITNWLDYLHSKLNGG